ncbi:tetratricopeptide repeat protein [Mucilaginibacter sp.]
MKKLLLVFLFIPCISFAQAAKDTSNEKTYIIQANSALFNKDYKSSIAYYTDAIRAAPTKALYYANRATAEWDLKDYEAAVKDLDTAISLPDKYAWIDYNQIGLIKMEEKDNKGAIKAFTRSIKLRPDESVYNNRALAELAIEEYQSSINDFTVAINYNNASRTLKKGHMYNTIVGNQYELRGKAKLLKGDYKDAVIDLDSAIIINPQLALAYNIRGEAKIKIGDKIGAFADWQTASNMNCEPAKENLEKYCGK